MPQINLISPTVNKEIKKKAKSFEMPNLDFPALLRLVLFSALPLGLILGAVSFGLFMLEGNKEADLKKITEKETSLAINPQDLTRWNDQKTALNKKIELLAELSSPGLSWSAKLSEISNCLPAGVWFTEIYLRKAIQGVEGSRAANDAKPQDILIIRGSAVAPQIDNAVAFVGEFVSALKQDKSFNQDFSDIKLNAIYKSAIGKSDVMNFELACYLR